MTQYVLGFEEIDRAAVALAGGKGAHLGELSRLEGVRVPAGFCVTTSAYQRIVVEARTFGDLLERLSPAMIEAAGRGIGADVSAFRADYDARIAAVLADATLEAPQDQRPILGGRRGHHGEHLGHLLAVMQFLPRTYPDATW